MTSGAILLVHECRADRPLCGHAFSGPAVLQKVHLLILRAASASLSSVLSVSGTLARDKLRENHVIFIFLENGDLHGFGPLVCGNSGLVDCSH